MEEEPEDPQKIIRHVHAAYTRSLLKERVRMTGIAVRIARILKGGLKNPGLYHGQFLPISRTSIPLTMPLL
jgi:hypothetical protein